MQKQVKFILDANGKKTDVIIPIGKYEELLEDLADLKSIKERKNEKLISIEDLKKQIGLDDE